jgi:hypothetical protein
MQWDVSHINYSQFEIRTNCLKPENFKNSVFIIEKTRFFPLRKWQVFIVRNVRNPLTCSVGNMRNLILMLKLGVHTRTTLFYEGYNWNSLHTSFYTSIWKSSESDLEMDRQLTFNIFLGLLVFKVEHSAHTWGWLRVHSCLHDNEPCMAGNTDS